VSPDVPIPDGNLVTTDHRVLSALMLFIRIHVRSRFTQDYRPGAFFLDRLRPG
jgi:hypothetical protein